jgi:hypothetical protein
MSWTIIQDARRVVDRWQRWIDSRRYSNPESRRSTQSNLLKYF